MEQQLIQCSGCKKRFFEDGFKVSRLKKRLRTCLECNERDIGRKKHHANLRLQAFDTINKMALAHGWICRIPAKDYTNAQTRGEWECATCGRICNVKWKVLYSDMKFRRWAPSTMPRTYYEPGGSMPSKMDLTQSGT